MIQNGGTFIYSPANQTYFFVGATANPATRAVYYMNGGVLDLSGNTLVVGFSDNTTTTGIVYQAGGVINNVGTLAFYTPPLPGGTGYGNNTLSGGSLYLGSGGIVSSSGTHDINLGGGTVGAYASWSSSLNMNLTNLNGSVTFDPAGSLITLSGVLSGTGGLTVAGPVTLELSGANTYAGDTVVQAGGTLQLDRPGTANTFRLARGAKLNLNHSSTYVVATLYTNGVALPVGTYHATNLPEFITGTGDLKLPGLVFSTEPQSQMVHLNQDPSATFTSMVVGGSATYQWYLIGHPIPAATNSSVTLPHLQITDGGNVFVVATGDSGSVTSRVVALTIYAVNNAVFAYDGLGYTAGSVGARSPLHIAQGVKCSAGPRDGATRCRTPFGVRLRGNHFESCHPSPVLLQLNS